MKTHLFLFLLLTNLFSFSIFGDEASSTFSDPKLETLYSILINAEEEHYGEFKAQLMNLNFQELSQFQENLTEANLQQLPSIFAYDGGVIGNGGGVVGLPNGKTGLADIYIDLKNFGTDKIPNYYQPFSFDKYPNLKIELDKIITLVDRRFGGAKFLQTTMDEFLIVNTPILMQNIAYSVSSGASFRSAAFTYIAATSDPETFNYDYQRIIEIKTDEFDRLESDRERALLLFHEYLHHSYVDIYTRYPDRYILISNLVLNLNILLDAYYRQQNGDHASISDEELDASYKLQMILARYEGIQEDLAIYISEGGGVSDSKEIAKNNYLDLMSKVQRDSSDSTEFYSWHQEEYGLAYYAEMKGNKFYNSNIEIRSEKITNSTFTNVGTTKTVTLIKYFRRSGKQPSIANNIKISNIFDVNHLFFNEKNLHINNIKSISSGKTSVVIEGSYVYNITLGGGDTTIINSIVKSTHLSSAKTLDSNIKFSKITLSDVMQSEIKNSIIDSSSITSSKVYSSKTDRIKGNSINLFSNSSLKSSFYGPACEVENMSFGNSKILISFVTPKIAPKKHVTIENLNISLPLITSPLKFPGMVWNSFKGEYRSYSPNIVHQCDWIEKVGRFDRNNTKVKLYSNKSNIKGCKRYTISDFCSKNDFLNGVDIYEEKKLICPTNE